MVVPMSGGGDVLGGIFGLLFGGVIFILFGRAVSGTALDSSAVAGVVAAVAR